MAYLTINHFSARKNITVELEIIGLKNLGLLTKILKWSVTGNTIFVWPNQIFTVLPEHDNEQSN